MSLPCALPFLVPSTIYTAEIGFRTIVPIAIQSGLFCWQGGQLKLCFAFLHIVIILSAPFFLPHLEMVPLFGRNGANGSSHYQNDHPHPQRNVDPQQSDNKTRVAGTLNTSQAYLRIRLSILHVHFLTAGSAGGLCFTIA